MFTICPKCALTLVVTAADLRVAQGYVRCGRCLNVFSALARLSEERPAGTAEAALDELAGASPVKTTPGQPPDPSSTDDDTGEIEIELDARAFAGSALAAGAPESTAEHEAQPLAADAAGSVPREPPEPEASAKLPEPEASAKLLEPEASGDSPGAPPAGQLVSPAQPDSAAPAEMAEPSFAEQTPQAQETNTAPQAPESAFESKIRRPRTGLAWKLGAGALAIALALQIVNHYRDSLAAHAALRGPLHTVYSALGVTLAPHWNVHAYDVRQLGASVAGAAAGEIIVRASVKNSARGAQPLPLLRVTLQDRFGNRIAARDVPPSDYLPSPVARGSLLAAGSRVDATMVFVDPGPKAVGFEIDACLRQRSGAVRCAHGP
ncbi:MAG: DUF3426 domain-containing protein [Steroidobacteraceae bacterium]